MIKRFLLAALFATIALPAWAQITPGCAIATTSVVGCVKPDGTSITITAGGTISAAGAPPTGSAGGALTGTYPNPTIASGAAIASPAFSGTATGTYTLGGAPSLASGVSIGSAAGGGTIGNISIPNNNGAVLIAATGSTYLDNTLSIQNTTVTGGGAHGNSSIRVLDASGNEIGAWFAAAQLNSDMSVGIGSIVGGDTGGRGFGLNMTYNTGNTGALPDGYFVNPIQVLNTADIQFRTSNRTTYGPTHQVTHMQMKGGTGATQGFIAIGTSAEGGTPTLTPLYPLHLQASQLVVDGAAAGLHTIWLNNDNTATGAVIGTNESVLNFATGSVTPASATVQAQAIAGGLRLQSAAAGPTMTVDATQASNGMRIDTNGGETLLLTNTLPCTSSCVYLKVNNWASGGPVSVASYGGATPGTTAVTLALASQGGAQVTLSSGATTNLTIGGGASPTAQFAGTLGVTGATTLSTTFFLTSPGTDAGLADSSLCRVTATGAVVIGTGTVGICLGTSSARYKVPESIVPSQPVERDALLGTVARDYRYLPGYGDGGEKVQHWFVAEEVVKTFPDCVALDASGKPTTVDPVCMTQKLWIVAQQQERKLAGRGI